MKRNIVLLGLFVMLMAFVNIGQCSEAAAQFTSLNKVNKFGAWKEGVHRYERTGRHLCLAEATTRDGTVVRVVFYIYEDDSWVELFNRRWKLPKGEIRTVLKRSDNLSLELIGESEADVLLFDLKTKAQYENILGFLAGDASSIVVSVAKNQKLTEINLNGAREALRSLFQCFDPLNRGSTNVYTGPSYR